MTEVRVVEEVEAPATAVFAIFADFGGVATWSKGIESCAVEGEGLGAVRELGLPGGLKLRERLEALDLPKRHFSYSIVEPAPVPFMSYLARVDVREVSPSRCEVTWQGRFEPNGVAADQASAIVRSIYTGGLKAIRNHLAR